MGFLDSLFGAKPEVSDIRASYMRTSILLLMLDTLKKSLAVDNVFAIVDKDNTKCLALMETFQFNTTSETLPDPTNGHKDRVIAVRTYEHKDNGEISPRHRFKKAEGYKQTWQDYF